MRLSLRSKILYSFLVASMLLMFTVAGIMYSNFSEIMFERASTDMSDLLVNEKNNLDLLVGKIKKCGDYIALNEYMTSTATLAVRVIIGILSFWRITVRAISLR